MSQPKSKFVQVFERDQGRCVYCGRDLKADFDTFMMAEEDHLVPGSKSGYKRDLDNLVLACSVCNRLKANFEPSPAIDAKKERRRYVTAVRAYIMQRRGERMKEFLQVTHPTLPDYQ